VTPAAPPEPTLFGEPGGARKAQAKRGGRGAAPPSSGGPPEPAGPSAPLAARLRPRTLDELVGQQHLLGPGSVLRGLVEEDKLRSVLLYGPPGTGKTSIALVIALATSAHFEQLSAVTSLSSTFSRILLPRRVAPPPHSAAIAIYSRVAAAFCSPGSASSAA